MFWPTVGYYQPASNNDNEKCERYNTAFINKLPMHLQMWKYEKLKYEMLNVGYFNVLYFYLYIYINGFLTCAVLYLLYLLYFSLVAQEGLKHVQDEL